MTRDQLENYITQAYGAEGERMWMRYPSFAVFRHDDNRKWFAVVMTIPKSRLGIDGDGDVDVVNLKCEIASLMVDYDGIYPAYHMSKDHWVSVALDGRVAEGNLKALVEMSYDLTAKKLKCKTC